MKTILISICLAATPLTVAQDKPNVIVIVADDLGYADALASTADKGRSEFTGKASDENQF